MSHAIPEPAEAIPSKKKSSYSVINCNVTQKRILYLYSWLWMCWRGGSGQSSWPRPSTSRCLRRSAMWTRCYSRGTRSSYPPSWDQIYWFGTWGTSRCLYCSNSERMCGGHGKQWIWRNLFPPAVWGVDLLWPGMTVDPEELDWDLSRVQIRAGGEGVN